MIEKGRFDTLNFETALADRFDDAEDSEWTSNLMFDGEGILSDSFDAPAANEKQEWLGEVQSAEAEAALASSAEWLETEWLDTSSETSEESVPTFAARLGREWSGRLKGEPDADSMRNWLLKDHEDTLAGARLRWTGKRATPALWDRVSRAWMVSREEQMRFKTEPSPGVAGLGHMAPPAQRPTLSADPLIGGSNVAPVAPLTSRFVRALRSRFGPVDVSNYRGHGGGAFLNRGYSLDIFLPGRDARGFYRREDALRLLRAINAAARSVGAQWRAIYNDHAVAAAINKELRRRHVIFVGGVRRDKAKRVTGLNWHGPDPLILHFHLDIAPLSGSDEGETLENYDFEMQTPWQVDGCGCAKKSREAEEEQWNESFKPRADAGETLSTEVEARNVGEELAWSDYENRFGEEEWLETEGQEMAGQYFEEEAVGSDFVGESDYLDFSEAEEEGGEGFAGGSFQSLLASDEALAAEFYFAEDAEFAHEAFDCSAPLGQPNLECEFPGRKKIIPAGNKKGLLLTRTVNDPRLELSLQFADYDINATSPHKEAHNNGVAQVTEFILARVRESKAEVVVHLSGSASLTDRASYNRRLSCQRARCLAAAIQIGLDPFTRSRVRFTIDDKGFDEAVCRKSPGGRGENCELGEFRSVRVTVTGRAGKVIPVPVNPRWDQFDIRVCRFESKSLTTVVIDELLAKVPEGMPRDVAEKLGKILKSRLLKALEKRAPKLLSRALGGISSALKWIPIEITRQFATFQIRERKKPVAPGQKTEVRTITLCYEGWGGRLAIPFDTLVLDGIDQMLGAVRALERQPVIKKLLGDLLKTILKPVLTERLTLIGSETVGDWKPFNTKNKMLVEGFTGSADVMIDMLSSMVKPGTIHLGFNGFEFNSKTNPSPNALQCGDCAGPVIPLVVSGGGFDIWSVSTGSMSSKGCVCVQPRTVQLLEFV